MAGPRFKVQVCRGPECGDRRGAGVLVPAFARVLVAEALADQVELSWQSCFGRCSLGPNVLVRELPADAAVPSFAAPPGPRRATALYSGVDVAREDWIVEIVREHVGQGRVVERLLTPPREPANPAAPVRRPGDR